MSRLSTVLGAAKEHASYLERRAADTRRKAIEHSGTANPPGALADEFVAGEIRDAVNYLEGQPETVKDKPKDGFIAYNTRVTVYTTNGDCFTGRLGSDWPKPHDDDDGLLSVRFGRKITCILKDKVAFIEVTTPNTEEG